MEEHLKELLEKPLLSLLEESGKELLDVSLHELLQEFLNTCGEILTPGGILGSFCENL